MRRKRRTYAGKDIAIGYDIARCIHAEECARGLPAVFDPKRKPWVDPEAAPADAIAGVIHRCPTGALAYERADGVAEIPDADATMRVDPNGPLYLRGRVRIKMPDGEVIEESRVALCRCGHSKNKPFCDDSHYDAGFSHPGTVVESKVRDAGEVDEGVEVTLIPNASIRVIGEFTLVAADGATFEGSKAAFCRCGHSANKPFCDATHKTVGFEAD